MDYFQVALVVIPLGVVIALKVTSILRRDRSILTYAFHPRLDARLKHAYPDLSDAQRAQVWDALRSYFVMVRHARGARVEMPSRLVDRAWHEFICETRAYTDFCDNAFGRYLHHDPSGDGTEPTSVRRRTISTQAPGFAAIAGLATEGAVLPLLFTIDQDFGVPNGFAYQLSTHDFQKRSTDSGSSGSGCGAFASACSSGGHAGGHSAGDAGGGSSCGSSCGGGCGGD